MLSPPLLCGSLVQIKFQQQESWIAVEVMWQPMVHGAKGWKMKCIVVQSRETNLLSVDGKQGVNTRNHGHKPYAGYTGCSASCPQCGHAGCLIKNTSSVHNLASSDSPPPQLKPPCCGLKLMIPAGAAAVCLSSLESADSHSIGSSCVSRENESISCNKCSHHMMNQTYSMYARQQKVHLSNFTSFTSEFDLSQLLMWSSAGMHSQFPAGTECFVLQHPAAVNLVVSCSSNCLPARNSQCCH